jgi:hypothetical protein
MSRILAAGAALLCLALFLPAPASATCSSNLSCYPACSQEADCNVGPPCFLFCSYPAGNISCTGNSVCLVDAGARTVQCDGGPVISCPATPACSSTSTSVTCGTTHKFCAVHGNICPK